MHVVLPHVPWCYLPSGARYADDGEINNFLVFTTHDGLHEFWGDDDLLVAQSQQRYLLQLGYVDRLIGELVARLQACGLYDRCLLIVTGDHGVSFRADQPRRSTSPENLGDILSIPLFIKRPFQAAGEISDRHVESIDLFPTVVDVLGIQLRDPVEGWSVLDTTHPERDRMTIYDGTTAIEVDPAVIVNSDVPRILRGQFGSARDPDALFRIGPFPELVGRRIASLEQSAEPSVEIELLPNADASAEPSASHVPCFHQGFVRSPVDRDRPLVLAVAVNGVIRAVTRTYLLDGLRDRWAAMVPESSLQSHQNDIGFFAVTGSGPEDWQISPCTIRSPNGR
jgi:hypothetical protein